MANNISDKVRYLGKNTIIFGISSFGTKLLSFLLVPLYTNVLTTAEYGTADLISSTSTLLIYILTINIEDGILRFIIDNKDEHTDILSYGIKILFRGTLICSLGLGIIYCFRIIDWPLEYFVFILLYFFFTAFYQIMLGYLRGLEKVTSVAIAGIISAVAMILSNIICLLVLKLGITGYLLSHVIGVLSGTVYCIIAAHEPVRTYFRNSCRRDLVIEIRTYCIPLIFNNLSLWINAFLDRFFVTAMCGVAENGVYSVASKIPTILATCYSVFSQAWNLTTLKEFDSNDSDGFFSKTYGVYNSITCIACSLLVLVNIPLARFLYAKGFFQAWRYSSILLLFVMFNSLTIFLGSIFNAAKDTRMIARTTIISAISNTIMNALLIPKLGATGAAIATVISYVIMWSIRMWLCKKYINLSVSIVRDVLSYIVLFVQVALEHQTGVLYNAQVLCLCLVLILQWDNIYIILRKFRTLLRRT